MRIERAIEEAFVTLLGTVFPSGTYNILHQEEDALLNVEPEDEDEPKITKPSLIVTATDAGRAIKRTAVRLIRTTVTYRVNSKLPEGQEAAFTATCTALEELLERGDLETSLSNATVHCFGAGREGSAVTSSIGLIRTHTHTLNLTAVLKRYAVA